MPTDPLLSEKRRVQRLMAERAGYDTGRLADIVDAVVREAAREPGLRLRYADLDGGFLAGGTRPDRGEVAAAPVGALRSRSRRRSAAPSTETSRCVEPEFEVRDAPARYASPKPVCRPHVRPKPPKP